MRKSIITELKKITEVSNRVFQPFTASTTVTKPYIVAKMSGENPVVDNQKGSMIELQVFIYNSVGSFISLDTLELKVKKLLHKKTLSTDSSPAKYFTLFYDRTLADFYDDTLGLFVKIIYFYIPMART